ncbi:hypothetical protein BJ944DRAFT_246343 [Cunninghamella echinulata]|nr:hypothetical protein BJ944DRAFT_246343 [Cunninghamella echinulata]
MSKNTQSNMSQNNNNNNNNNNNHNNNNNNNNNNNINTSRPSEKAKVIPMDSPPPTPLQTTDYDYNNTDNYNKDNCLFIDTTTTTTTTTMISQSEYYGEDLFGSLSSQGAISPTFTTTQGLFPPISERTATDAEGDNNFNNNDLQQDISVMDDDDIFAEISDTFCLNDNLQLQQPIALTTEDFLLF